MALARWGRLRENSKALDLAAEAMRFDDQSCARTRRDGGTAVFPRTRNT